MNHKQPITTKAATQEAPVITIQTTTAKVKKNLRYIIMAVVCATAFFAHETVASESEEVFELRETWKQDKKNRTNALNNLKEASINLPEYALYDIERIKTNNSFSKLNEAKDQNKFLAFNSFQHFLGEFGWAFAVFLYALFNLLLTFRERGIELLGKVIFHTTIVFISIFFLRYCFEAQDFSQWQYIIMNLASAFALMFAVYLYVRYQVRKDAKLYQDIKDLVGYILNKNFDDEKAWEVLDKVSKDD